jgi:hypothetical protein
MPAGDRLRHLKRGTRTALCAFTNSALARQETVAWAVQQDVRILPLEGPDWKEGRNNDQE